MTASLAHTGFAEALAAFQAEEVTFAKTKTATVKNQAGAFLYAYKYADLGDILPIVRPLLAKHGLSWSSKPGYNDAGDLVLTFRLLHASGEADGGEMPLGVGRGCKPQELGSAITYARRYALTAQLNLHADEDDDAQAAQHATRAPAKARQTNGELTDSDVKRLQQGAKGLKPEQIKLAFTACGIPIPDPPSWRVVPREKAPILFEALAGIERES